MTRIPVLTPTPGWRTFLDPDAPRASACTFTPHHFFRLPAIRAIVPTYRRDQSCHIWNVAARGAPGRMTIPSFRSGVCAARNHSSLYAPITQPGLPSSLPLRYLCCPSVPSVVKPLLLGSPPGVPHPRFFLRVGLGFLLVGEQHAAPYVRTIPSVPCLLFFAPSRVFSSPTNAILSSASLPPFQLVHPLTSSISFTSFPSGRRLHHRQHFLPPHRRELPVRHSSPQPFHRSKPE